MLDARFHGCDLRYIFTDRVFMGDGPPSCEKSLTGRPRFEAVLVVRANGIVAADRLTRKVKRLKWFGRHRRHGSFDVTRPFRVGVLEQCFPVLASRVGIIEQRRHGVCSL
jgi:hypothetical protein